MARVSHRIESVCVFCGSSLGTQSGYETAARQVGTLLGKRKMTLVYGGGNVGLMGVAAEAALAEGGKVIGVIPKSLAAKELAHHGVSELHVVESMHERKAKMAQFADAFLALPGGFGTFEEFCEIVTWRQLGFHQKPCGILNVGGYYDALLAQFDLGVEQGFIRSSHRQMIVSSTEPTELLERLAGS